MANALRPNLTLSDERERDVDPDVDLVRVNRILKLADGPIVCTFSACLPDTDTRVFKVEGPGELKPVLQPDCGSAAIWHGCT